MDLTIGQPLCGQQGGEYVVTGVRRRTPWFVLWEAEKVFFNYHFGDRELYAAGDDECLPVLLRSPLYADPSNAHAVQVCRELARYEATQVLGLRGMHWFPEPVDLLELAVGEPATRQDADPVPPAGPEGPEGRLPAGRDPIVVMARPSGVCLSTWLHRTESGNLPKPVAAMRCAAKCLDLLAALHEQGMVLGAFDPEEVTVDGHGRLAYLGTDHVFSCQQGPRLRPFFPPQRFAADFSAPEVRDPHGWIDPRSDLYSWAALTCFLLLGEGWERGGVWHEGASVGRGQGSRVGGERAGGGQTSALTEPVQRDSRDVKPAAELLRAALAKVGEHSRGALRHPQVTGGTRSTPEAVERWCQALLRCLQPAPSQRPDRVSALAGVRS